MENFKTQKGIAKPYDYEIEVLKRPTNGDMVWQRVAGFYKGETSRFGKPFNDEIAKKETEDFISHRGSEFYGVRLIINMQ